MEGWVQTFGRPRFIHSDAQRPHSVEMAPDLEPYMNSVLLDDSQLQVSTFASWGLVLPVLQVGPNKVTPMDMQAVCQRCCKRPQKASETVKR